MAHRAKDCRAPGATPSPQAIAMPKEGAAGPLAKTVTFDPTAQTPVAKACSTALASDASSSTSGYEMKQLMSETLQELRRLKPLSVKSGALLAATDMGTRKGLLDSGATHPLRPATVASWGAQRR